MVWYNNTPNPILVKFEAQQIRFNKMRAILNKEVTYL